MSALRDAIVLKLQATAGVTSLATGGIFPKLPPEGAATYPFIVVSAQQAPQARRVFGAVSYEEAVYLVKAIDQNSSPKRARTINAAIRAALDLATLSITGYSSMGIAWMGDVDMVEENDGQIYQHEGGLYSLMASPS